ncbi:MAG: dockerin type I domain-containing protein [Dehalococcoidia bacterium]
MSRRHSAILATTAVGLVAAFAVISLVLTRSASALPPGGSDTFNVSAVVSITSRLGSEDIPMTGSVGLTRSDPRMEGDFEVVDIDITSISLTGQSLTGVVNVLQSPTLISTGELRSLQPPPDQFPASSFLDIFVRAIVPGSPSATLTLRNEVALHFVPMAGGQPISLGGWPPIGVTYVAAPDPCIPLIPTLPAEVCVTGASITIEEQKTPTVTSTQCPVEVCTATPTSAQTSTPSSTATPCPPAVCTPTPTSTPSSTPAQPLPEDPSFSLAPGGPSGLHPASIFGASSLAVSPGNNDNFVNAFPIQSLPTIIEQSTVGMTREAGEPPPEPSCDIDATAWFRFTLATPRTVMFQTAGSDFDTIIALYAGSAINSLNQIGCDDDSGPGLQSEMSLPLSMNTTYYLQVGGFRGRSGNLILTILFPGGAGASPTGAGFSCPNLGLSIDGCDGGDGDQDDIDALSYGAEYTDQAALVAFSVAPGSRGLPGTGVLQQANCTPPEPQADEFVSTLNGTNTLFIDGSGVPGCPTGPAFGLTEIPASDDIDALNDEPPSFVDPDSDGQPELPVFFSLAPGSPSLETLGRGPADLLWTRDGLAPALYASAATLGLGPGDDLDALCLVDQGPGPTYSAATDSIMFSLAPGSPSLAGIGASAADVLGPGPEVRISASEMGLRIVDDLDALKCFAGADPTRTKIPVGDIWFCAPQFQGGVCETTVEAGDTVVWDFSAGDAPHTTTECGTSCNNPTASPLWDSGVISDDSTFKYTFDEPGTYLYYCEVHPTIHRGRIVVGPAGVPGDVNCSGSVSAIDVALVLQNIAGLLSSLPCEQNADVSGNGSTDSIDAALMLQFIAGFLDEL